MSISQNNKQEAASRDLPSITEQRQVSYLTPDRETGEKGLTKALIVNEIPEADVWFNNQNATYCPFKIISALVLTFLENSLFALLALVVSLFTSAGV